MNAAPDPKAWHALPVSDTLGQLKSGADGLSPTDANERFRQYGPNRIREEKEEPWWRILVRQFNFFFWVLLLAMVFSIYVDNHKDAVFIAAILVLNTLLAFFQEYKASRAMGALKNFLVEGVKVLRGGQPVELDATAVVPGDIILLEEGMKVPADARCIEEHALRIDEAMLTGESLPVDKSTAPVPKDADLGDRRSMLFAGTTIVRGTGRAVVTATGMQTELGRIAQALQDTQTPKTSFEIEIDKLSRNITLLIVGLVVFVAILGYFEHIASFNEIVIFSLSLGVGAIPESLPVVLSFALSVGAQVMARRKALVRRLAIVESLGSVDVIGSDKTGTLTKNEMTAQLLYVPAHDPYYVTGEGYDPANGSIQTRHVGDIRLRRPLTAMLLCNDTKKTSVDGTPSYMGDPTEIALYVAAEKGGIDPVTTLAAHPREGELPFTSDRQRMSTLHKIDGTPTLFCKGAPEVVLERCGRILIHGDVTTITDEHRREIHDTLAYMQNEALRVLAIAERALPAGMEDPASDEDAAETDLVFLGLAGLIDPPRPEVKVALAEAREAGIKTVMITGDHINTASAIAKRLGMGTAAATGRDLETLSDTDLRVRVKDLDIVARATPVTKLRVLRALQANRHFAAMTGDGVNDSPALKQADVGIAMGLRGTDAAREASGLVLLDDNFATIVSAIEEGRRIFDNIRKFINYLLTCNIGEVITVILGVLILKLPPLTAIMVLWINILTDVLPAIALGVDPANPGLMKRPPRPHGESIINKGLAWTTVLVGIKKGIENFLVFVVGYYWIYAHLGEGPDRLLAAQTMAFTGIVVYAFVRIFVIRTFDSLGLMSNPWLLISLAVAALMQLFIMYCPPVAAFLEIYPLNFHAWAVQMILAVWAGVTGIWLSKWIASRCGSIVG